MSKLQPFLNVADHFCALNECAMNACHQFNMQGFKRLHRFYSREFFDKSLKVRNFSLDFLQEPLYSEGSDTIHTPSSLKESMSVFISNMQALLKKLAEANNAYRADYGVGFGCGEEMMKCMAMLLCKFRRWYDRFEKNGWAAHDLFVLDNWLHAKYKEREATYIAQE